MMKHTLLTALLLPLAAQHATEPGLIAHWNFDEGRGGIARDVSGHGHDATLKNVEWAPSPRGHALRFDSKEDAARYGGLDSMNLSGDATLAVWVKTDSAAAPHKHRLIFGDSGAGVQRNLHLSLDSYNRLSFEWADGRSNDSLLAPASLLNGLWKHVAVVADSRAMQVAMHVDGVEVARKAMSLPISRAPTTERLTGWFYNGFFQGELDDIRLYNRALPAEEVQRLFASQADVQAGVPAVLFDGSRSAPRGIAATTFRNWSKEPRRVEVSGPAASRRELTLDPGGVAEVMLGEVALQPLWSHRNGLFLCEQMENGTASVTIRRGDMVEQASLGLVTQQMLEPLRLRVKDPWQRQMAPGKTSSLEVDVQLAMPGEQLRDGTLRLRLVSRESKREALARQVKSPRSQESLTLDVRELPWGAYHLQAGFHDRAGREIVSVTCTATILPDGSQQIRVLNNLVSELMDARARGLLQSPRIEFMNPRDGWVWFGVAGNCELALGDDRLPVGEAMRLLPAGRHVLQVSGAPNDVAVRAIPALVYNLYPSGTQIAPFGPNTWERLRKHTLPSSNMIESHVVDVPEQKEWTAQGKMWLANVQAPGLLDTKDWTEEKLLELWRNPGMSTAHAERPGLELAKVSGMQVDEYYPGAKSTRFPVPLARSLARFAESPEAAGKFWIPFTAGKYGATPDNLLLRTVLGAGWPFSEEVYAGEMPTEEENLSRLRTQFRSVAESYESALPGSVRRMIFTPMDAYLPYCTANRYPQADFRVHLDMQMQLLANDPAFFGLWGVQPYRSNYVDEEILNCMGRLLRHYGIEGKTARLLSDPYELRHVTDPDFEQGTTHWQVTAAEEGATGAGQFAGYGTLEGRYPPSAAGDTFLRLKRSAKRPNILSQKLQALEPGRIYSLKLFSADHGDLLSGKSRKATQTVSITLDGADVLPGAFRYPFRSCREVKPFTAKMPFWMTYHWLRFRATGPTARLVITDWAKPGEPGAPIGQELILNFVELQPAME